MNKMLLGVALLIGAYLAGRYSAPEKIKIETKTEYKEVLVKDESRKVNQVQRVIETISKDGRPIRKTVTKTVEASQRTENKKVEAVSREHKEIENRRGVTVNALVGMPLNGEFITRPFVYGASFTKPFLGPIVIGAWAFTDLRVGLSIGMEL